MGDDTMLILDYNNTIGGLLTVRTIDRTVPLKFEIDKVIFNKPATIVLWADGTKTVVKCGKNDVFDPEKGLAMCFAKKAIGNKGRYYNVFKQHLPEEYSKVTLYADDQAVCVAEPDKE